MQGIVTNNKERILKIVEFYKQPYKVDELQDIEIHHVQSQEGIPDITIK